MYYRGCRGWNITRLEVAHPNYWRERVRYFILIQPEPEPSQKAEWYQVIVTHQIKFPTLILICAFDVRDSQCLLVARLVMAGSQGLASASGARAGGEKAARRDSGRGEGEAGLTQPPPPLISWGLVPTQRLHWCTRGRPQPPSYSSLSTKFRKLSASRHLFISKLHWGLKFSAKFPEV